MQLERRRKESVKSEAGSGGSKQVDTTAGLGCCWLALPGALRDLDVGSEDAVIDDLCRGGLVWFGCRGRCFWFLVSTVVEARTLPCCHARAESLETRGSHPAQRTPYLGRLPELEPEPEPKPVNVNVTVGVP